MNRRYFFPLIKSIQGIPDLVFRQWRFTRYLWIIAGLLFIGIYIIGDYGIIQIFLKVREVQRLQEDINQLESEHAFLLEQKAQLEAGDKSVIEKIAREKFGMVKDGEVLYRVIMEKDKNTSSAKLNSLMKYTE